MPADAHRLRADGTAEDVPVSELQPWRPRAGEARREGAHRRHDRRGPLDARRGACSPASRKPVDKGEGDEIIGGAINGEGASPFEVRKTGDETYLAQVIELVRQAQESRSRTQDLANRAALWLTVIALGVGGVTLVVWLLLGQTASPSRSSAWSR